MLSYAVGYSTKKDHDSGWCVMAFELVGVAGFEPAASSSRTKRAAKLRYTPAPRAECPRRTSASLADNQTPVRRDNQALAVRGTRVRRVASGRQANLAGAHGDVPRPPETYSHAVLPSGRATCGCMLSPRTRARSMPQFVTSAP